VRDTQLPANVTRPYAHTGQFDNAHAHRVGQRSAVDEHAAQLVYLTVLLLLLLQALLVLLQVLLVLL
jgi:hypothetical protein